MSSLYLLKASLIMAVITIIFRLLPFIALGGRKDSPFIVYLGKCLPYAIMGMLLVYCLKEVNPLSGNHGLPEALAILLVFGLHKWKHSTMISISLGTVFYMVLVQLVFI